MDMTTDIGAGGNALPYRWRPMGFEVDGVEYCNERATATQQTGFWFTAQARGDKGSDMGILWFGVDDAATSCLTPIYSCSTEVAEAWGEASGTMLSYSPSSAFWTFNLATNFAYMNYDSIAPDICLVADAWELSKLAQVEQIDQAALELTGEARAALLTQYSVETAEALVERWQSLFGYLMVKHLDGNRKAEHGSVIDFLDGARDSSHFVNNGERGEIPSGITNDGYSDKWKRAVAADNGETLIVK